MERKSADSTERRQSQATQNQRARDGASGFGREAEGANQRETDDQELSDLDALRQQANDVITKWRDRIKKLEESDNWDQGSLKAEAEADLDFWRNKNSEVIIQSQKAFGDRAEQLRALDVLAAEAAQEAEKFLLLVEIHRQINGDDGLEQLDAEQEARRGQYSREYGDYVNACLEFQQSKAKYECDKEHYDYLEKVSKEGTDKLSLIQKTINLITDVGGRLLQSSEPHTAAVGTVALVAGSASDFIFNFRDYWKLHKSRETYEKSEEVMNTKEGNATAIRNELQRLSELIREKESEIFEGEKEWVKQLGKTLSENRYSEVFSKEAEQTMVFRVWQSKRTKYQKSIDEEKEAKDKHLPKLEEKARKAKDKLEAQKGVIRNLKNELQEKPLEHADVLQEIWSNPEELTLATQNKLQDLSSKITELQNNLDEAVEKENDDRAQYVASSNWLHKYREEHETKIQRLKNKYDAIRDVLAEFWPDHFLKLLAEEYEKIVNPIKEHENSINGMSGMRTRLGDRLRMFFNFPTYKSLVAEIIRSLEDPKTVSQLEVISASAKKVSEKTKGGKASAFLEEVSLRRNEKYEDWKKRQEEYDNPSVEDEDRGEEPSGARYYQHQKDKQNIAVSKANEKAESDKQERMGELLYNEVLTNGLVSEIKKELSDDARSNRKVERDDAFGNNVADQLAETEGHHGLMSPQEKRGESLLPAEKLKQHDDLANAKDHTEEVAEEAIRELRLENPKTPEKVNDEYIAKRKETNIEEQRRGHTQLNSLKADSEGKQNQVKEAISNRSYVEYWWSGSPKVEKAAADAKESEEKVQACQRQLGALAAEKNQLGRTGEALDQQAKAEAKLKACDEQILDPFQKEAEGARQAVDNAAKQYNLPTDRSQLNNYANDALPGRRTEDYQDARKESEENVKDFEEGGNCTIQ